MLALMLVLSMAATAFATETGTEQTKAGETKATEIKVTKTYNDPVGYGAKFFFDVKKIEDPTTGTDGMPDLTIDPFSFAADHPNPVETAEALVKITNFEKEGSFKYTVKETQIWGAADDITAPHAAPDLKGGEMTMSKAEYEVTVTIKKTGRITFEIESVVATQLKDDAGNTPAGDGKVDELAFVNTYAKEAGVPTDPTTGALLITKEVVNTLNAADETAFDFTLKVTYPAGGNPFRPDFGTATWAPQLDGTGGEATFSLKHNENIVVRGLPIGTVVNVIEVGVSPYKPSAQVTMGAGEPVSTSELAAGATLTLDALSVPQRTLGEGKNAVEVTNTYNYVAPTGVILNVLPYVLMVAIAGGMIVLFTVIKRRKAQDYED
jgi:hypothetical protein